MRKKNARWIRHTHVFRADDYECTACGYFADMPYSVCPNCGRTMNGTKYDPSWVDEMEAADAIFDD